ncbi:hypothetical protein PGTUg99_024470 [Puccinia graminis f. sp. tritici]|uniref:Uncharacterized protein n=1 Tax=Puccinia graminis f. sp. tritici TaxID=56615 RepID=A0A5B0MHP0_PUCGR|nr:hypothetical protein PGTUg99_024470 [Puccinia graminis f. sp. tritici]
MHSVLKIAFILCGLPAIRYAMDSKIGIALPDSKRFIEETNTNAVDSGSGGWKRSGSLLKRPREDSISTAYTCPPSRKAALRSKHAVIVNDENKNFSINSEQVEKVQQCSEETLANFNNWKAAFVKLKSTHGKSLKFKNKLNALVGSVSNIFEHRITELKTRPSRIYSNGRKSSAYHLSKPIPREWLNSVAEIGKIWEPLDPKNNKAEEFLIKRGVNLMIDFFIDLQRLEIIPEEQLSHFLNKENEGKLILSYATHGFPSSQLTLANVYTNFNIRLSLQEGTGTKKLRNLLQLLDKNTWKLIEFDYLATCLNGIQENKINRLHVLQEEFLRIASPHNPEISTEKLKDLLYQLAKRIVEIRWLRPTIPTEKELIGYKRLYEMWSYIVHFHAQDRSPELLSRIWGFADGISAFEEGIGLLSSVHHLLHVRRNQLDVLLNKELHQSEVLVDENENRRIASLKKFDVEYLNKLFYIHNLELSRNHFGKPGKLNLLQLLDNNDMVKNSIVKTKIQHQRYLTRLQKFNHNPASKNSFEGLLGYFEVLSRKLLEHQKTEFKKLFSELK